MRHVRHLLLEERRPVVERAMLAKLLTVIRVDDDQCSVPVGSFFQRREQGAQVLICECDLAIPMRQRATDSNMVSRFDASLHELNVLIWDCY